MCLNSAWRRCAASESGRPGKAAEAAVSDAAKPFAAGGRGILVLHLLGPLLLPDGESVGFLVVGGFLWGCHRSNCMFLSRFPTEAPGAFPGQGFPGAMQGSAGLIMLGCLGAVLCGAIPSAREPRRLLCALAALVWGLFGIFWHGMSGPERKNGRKKK